LVYSKIGPARGTAETGDRFGSAVAFLANSDLDFDSGEHLVVGAPGEDVGRMVYAGGARTVPPYRYCEHGCGRDE